MTAPVETLKLSRDRKVSPRGKWDPKYQRWYPLVYNSFGLPAGVTCPGRTPFCDSCYGINAESRPVVGAMLANNYRLLAAADFDGKVDLCDDLIGRQYLGQKYIGDTPQFRWHWDGDFDTVEYAEAAAVIFRRYRWVNFWCYTRSFRPPVDVVPTLAGIPNLRLYLSADRWNQQAAVESAEQHDVRLALRR